MTTKKTYTHPTVYVVQIASHNRLLAGSLDAASGSGTVTEEMVPAGTDGEAPKDIGGFGFDGY